MENVGVWKKVQSQAKKGFITARLRCKDKGREKLHHG
jgi:hypothetical protein